MGRNNTANRQPRLFNAVRQYLDRERWDYAISTDGDGSFLVLKRFEP